MAGISLVARETTYSRGSDQMCRHEARVPMSQEEQTAAEESFSVYSRPVELYNILQQRAVRNPSFLQRCLHYKLQAKQKRRDVGGFFGNNLSTISGRGKAAYVIPPLDLPLSGILCWFGLAYLLHKDHQRIQISISISGAPNDEPQTQSLFPFYMLLARPVSTTNVETQCTAVYHISQVCKLTVFGGAEMSSSGRAKFILPEMNKLSTEVKSGSLAVLLVSCADTTNPPRIDLTEDHMFSASLNRVGYCFFGKIPTLSLGGRAEMISTVIMQSCFMKLSCLDGAKCVSFRFPYNSEAVSILQQVPVIISAEEVGAKNMSPYDMYSYNDTPRPGIMRLRSGKVIFNYKYYNNMLQRTEVTEDFSCSFCLVKCASYKGLRFHLTSSHDLFHYEFWVTEDHRVMIVSIRTDRCSSEIITGNVDPRQQTFFYW